MTIHKSRLLGSLRPDRFGRSSSNPKTAFRDTNATFKNPGDPNREDFGDRDARLKAEEQARLEQQAKAKTRADTVKAAADLRRRLSLQKGRRSTIATSGRGLPQITAENVSRPGLSAPRTVFGGF